MKQAVLITKLADRHESDDRRCINPEHLEEVSKVENTRRRDVRKLL